MHKTDTFERIRIDRELLHGVDAKPDVLLVGFLVLTVLVIIAGLFGAL